MLAKAVVLGAVCAVPIVDAAALELPKKVTPAIRRACEKDVRRLCVRETSTVQSVKTCVRKNFRKLNMTCKIRLVRAGL